VEMMNGRPVRIVRCVFNMVAFNSDGTMMPPLHDRHIRAPNWRRGSANRAVTQPLRKPVIDLSLEAGNGHRQRRSSDRSSKASFEARSAALSCTIAIMVQLGFTNVRSNREKCFGCGSLVCFKNVLVRANIGGQGLQQVYLLLVADLTEYIGGIL
jgi:hypothetical protein